MVNGPGVVNLLWMLVGVWIGLLIARALPEPDASRCEAARPRIEVPSA